jgi:hypothetical protein
MIKLSIKNNKMQYEKLSEEKRLSYEWVDCDNTLDSLDYSDCDSACDICLLSDVCDDGELYTEQEVLDMLKENSK